MGEASCNANPPCTHTHMHTHKTKERLSVKKGREKGEKGRKSKKAEDKTMDDTQSKVSYAMPDTDLTRSKASRKAFSESHLPLTLLQSLITPSLPPLTSSHYTITPPLLPQPAPLSRLCSSHSSSSVWCSWS